MASERPFHTLAADQPLLIGRKFESPDGNVGLFVNGIFALLDQLWVDCEVILLLDSKELFGPRKESFGDVGEHIQQCLIIYNRTIKAGRQAILTVR